MFDWRHYFFTFFVSFRQVSLRRIQPFQPSIENEIDLFIWFETWKVNNWINVNFINSSFWIFISILIVFENVK